MNYYRRWIGDYIKKTAHLSLAEHGAYDILLDIYYSTERPLPASTDALCRLCRAINSVEQAAVCAVADEFFPIGDDGLRHNRRADKELGIAQATIEKQRKSGAETAAKRWSTDSDSTRSTDNDENSSTDDLTDRSTDAEGGRSPMQPPTSNHHPPAASLQPPTTNRQRKSAAPPPASGGPSPATAMAILLKNAGLSGATAANPKVIQLADEGYTDAEITVAVEIARRDRGKGDKPFHFSYIIGILTDQRLKRQTMSAGRDAGSDWTPPDDDAVPRGTGVEQSGWKPGQALEMPDEDDELGEAA